MKMNKILKSNEGFTILEVIIAVSILTVGILAVASMQVAAMRGNSFAWGTSQASTVAMNQIETLMGLSSVSYGDALLTQAGSPHTTTKTVDGRSYNIRWNVVDDQWPVIPGTKTVTLTVTWTDHGIGRNVSMIFTVGQVV
jgi:type IV pilus assembly protein PilV